MIQKNDVHSKKNKVKRGSIYKTVMSLLGFLILAMTGPGMALAEKIPEETYQKLKGLRIPFIMNQGQVDPQVKFYARTFSGAVYVTEEGRMVYDLPRDKDRKWVLVEEAVEGLTKREIKGEGLSKTQVSYFMGNDRTKWQNGLPTHETVDLGEVYQGIKLKLRAYGGSVEKLYYVSPGKEPHEIRVRVKGAESLRVNEKGELEVQTGNGPVIFSRPRAFQKQDGRQENVPVAYWVDGDKYGFKVEEYDKTRELIIDPLIQSTYLGGNSSDYINSLAVSGGNVYVAGYTSSSNFPGTTGGAQPAHGGGGTDGFVALLSGDLKQLIQSTYLGGNGSDYIHFLAVSGGNVYVAGYTSSSNFPGTTGGAQPAHDGGNTDGFVALLSWDLKQLIQSTYLGGSDDDYIYSLAVSGGNVCAAGATSSNFPGTTGGAQPAHGGGNTDGFVALLSWDLKQLIRSTYLGGNGSDYIYSLAVSGGNVYAAGYTSSNNFPGTTGGAQEVYGGEYADGFVSLLSGDLKTLIQSTYLGGNGSDYIHSLAVSGGNVYAAGNTFSGNFPGTAGGAQPAHGGVWDGFVSLLSGDLKTLIQSTYLGGSNNERIYSLAVSGGNVYAAGITSGNFPNTAGGAQPASGGTYDGFVALLSADLKRDSLPFVLTGLAGGIAWNSATLNGTVYAYGLSTTVTFEYGLTTAYGSSVTADQSPVTGTIDTSVNQALNGLIPNRTYHYRVVGVNLVGTSNGDDMTFTTTATAPAATTNPASGITATGATLNGTVNANNASTTVTFDYGLTTAYGNTVTADQSPVTGTIDTPVNQAINGLIPNRTYHYRVVGVNSTGTTYGSDGTFTTLKNTVADFDGNGKTDILWRHTGSGMVYLWLMNGASITSQGSPATVSDLDWEIKGVGEFNGDGKADILWRHSASGQVYLWLMDGTSINSHGSPATVSDLDWEIKGVGEFNGDGKADILWRHSASGQVYLWLMDGTSINSHGSPATVSDLDWEIKGVGEFNGDGKADILWQHSSSGMVYVWLMDGTSVISSGSPGTVSDPGWKIKGVVNNKSILWQHAGSGQLYIWDLSATNIISQGPLETVSDHNWQIQ